MKQRHLVWLALVACMSCTNGDLEPGISVDSGDTEDSASSDTADSGTDTGESPDIGGWVRQTIPTETHLRAALFAEATWVFGADPAVSLLLEGGAWTQTTGPAGGAVVAAGSSSDIGVVVTEDGVFHTWHGDSWQIYTSYTAPSRVWQLAVGSDGELYTWDGEALVVVVNGAPTRRDADLYELVALPDGGAVFADGSGVHFISPGTDPVLLTDRSRGGSQSLCARSASDLWVAGNDQDDGALSGHYGGASWSWNDAGSGSRQQTYVGLWCTPWDYAVYGYLWRSDGGPMGGSRSILATRILDAGLERWGPAAEAACGHSSSRLFPSPRPDPGVRVCSVQGRGEIGLMLGWSGTLYRWSP